MTASDKDKWLICKHYLHIDMPFGTRDMKHIREYVTNPENIARHPFLPLIRRVVKTYPYKHKNGASEKTMQPKIRELTFASHLDAVIYGYYAQSLQQKYEERLVEYCLEDVPTAYRRISDENGIHNKCNIEFARDVFNYIKNNLSTDTPLAVITFDIKGFFDNLDHKLLKRSWMKCLGVEHMPDDVYAIYKNVTQYSYIFEDQLFWMFHKKIKCRRKDGTIVERLVKNRKYLKDKGAVAYCKKEDIKEIRKQHIIRIRKKGNTKGIPQGLPISATLANVYMLDFDKCVDQHVRELNGIYRRYSDDMIIVCPLNKGIELQNWVRKKIGDVSLEIEPHKTNLFYFHLNGEDVQTEHVNSIVKSNLEYLGFSFDGKSILIKNASIGKYYAKMHRSILRSKYFAYHINNQTRGNVFQHRLITKFTPAGRKPHRPWSKSKVSHKLYHDPRVKRWGNFFAYAWKAADVMGNVGIKKQLRRSSHKLTKLMQIAKSDVADSIYRNSLRQLYTYGKIYKEGKN
jgi:hypothetical protein